MNIYNFLSYIIHTFCSLFGKKCFLFISFACIRSNKTKNKQKTNINAMNSFIVVSSQLLVLLFFTDFSLESLLLIFFCSYCYDMEWGFFFFYIIFAMEERFIIFYIIISLFFLFFLLSLV